MKYTVTIEETLSKQKTVEADSPEDALSIVKNLYDDGEVVLSADNFVEVTFGVDAPGPTKRFPLEAGRYIKDIILDTLEDAEKTIKCMQEIMVHYECVLVSDVYDIIGKDGTYEDSKYGWTDISDATIIQCEEGWKISLHQAFPIDALKTNEKETD